ncbi:hypothetical protein [Deinococcus sp. UYEF24]
MKLVPLTLVVCIVASSARAVRMGFDPRLAVKITTQSGKVVEIKGPKVDLEPNPDVNYSWGKPAVVANRDGKFTAVHYLGEMPKYWAAMVYLIRPDGQIQRLKQDTVLKILWTRDGKYLIGVGGNTLRLWNLSGETRQVTFQDIRSFGYRGGRICVNLNWYSPNTGQVSRSVERQLAVPSLDQVAEKETHGEETCRAL